MSRIGFVFLSFTSVDPQLSRADFSPIEQFFAEYSYSAPNLGRSASGATNRPLVSLETDPKEQLNNALRVAAREDRITDAQRALTQGADVNTVNLAGMSPLMFAARNCSPKMTELLIKGKADVNATDEQGRTPLIFATRESCWQVVELLVKTPGIHCLIRDRSQRTALDYASEDSQMEVGGASQKIMGLILFSGRG